VSGKLCVSSRDQIQQKRSLRRDSNVQKDQLENAELHRRMIAGCELGMAKTIRFVEDSPTGRHDE